MTKRESKVLQECDAKYQLSRSELNKLHKDFNEFEDLYWGYQERSKNAWKSNLFDPETFEKIERTVSHLFATSPRGRVLPRDSFEDIQKAPIMDGLVRYQWNKPGQNMHSKLQRTGRSTYIFGTGLGLLEWKYIKETRTVRENDMFIEKTEIVFDDPYFRDLYIYDCFPDPSATSIDDMQWFILNEYTTLGDLKNQNAPKLNYIRYKNLGELEKMMEEGKQDASQEQYRDRVDQTIHGNKGVLHDRILIRRLFKRNRWITIAPDFGIVLEDRSNPYTHGELPIHMLTDYDYPNQLFGRGEIDVIKKMQKGLNNTLNQRMDNVRLILSPVIKTTASSRHAHTWKFKPGQPWKMDNLNEVDVFSIPDVTGNTFSQTANYFKDSMARALGQNDILSNSQGRSSNTATRDQLAAGEQNARLKSKETNIDAFIVRLLNQWIQLNQQMITEARVVRVLGGDSQDLQSVTKGKTSFVDGDEIPKMVKPANADYASLVVDPEDLIGAFDYVVESGSMSAVDPNDGFQNISTALQMIQAAQPQLQAEGVKVNIRPILEKALYSLGIKSVDNIFEMQMQQQAPMGQQGVDPQQTMQAQPQAPVSPDEIAMMQQAQMMQ